MPPKIKVEIREMEIDDIPSVYHLGGAVHQRGVPHPPLKAKSRPEPGTKGDTAMPSIDQQTRRRMAHTGLTALDPERACARGRRQRSSCAIIGSVGR